MRPLTRTEWLVLNEVADDAEDVEHIYRSIAFSFRELTDHTGVHRCWMERDNVPPLYEIVDALAFMLDQQLLDQHIEDAYAAEEPASPSLLRSWFSMSPKGRELLEASQDVISSLL